MVNTRSNTYIMMSKIEEDPIKVFTVRKSSNISRRSSTSILNTTSPEPMITRSKTELNLQQSKRVEFTVNLDFDKASHEWRRNKKNEGNGSFTYKRSPLFVENKV